MEDIIEFFINVCLILIFCISVLMLVVFIYSACTGQLPKDEVIECQCECENCKCKDIKKNKTTTIIMPMPVHAPMIIR